MLAMRFEDAMEDIAIGFEVVGVAILVIGGIFAFVSGIAHFRNFDHFFRDVRRTFGRPLILGLEVLVAADIIKTITVDPSLESVGVLGILVAIRIALSISLDIEVDGVVPWHRARLERAPKQTDGTP